MRARHVAIMLLAVLMLAACAANQPSPSGIPSPTAIASPSPSSVPSPTATPVSSPQPTATPEPTSTRKPTPATLSANEKYLLAGVRKDAKIDCVPRRTDLPPRAIAGVECSPRIAGVERVGVYLFKTESALLATYKERMAAEGVKLNSGTCFEGEGEGAYMPGPENESANRNGCFLNDYGIANYRATLLPVYIGLLGTSDDTRALEAFAWKGNQDAPGTPTIWRDPRAS